MDNPAKYAFDLIIGHYVDIFIGMIFTPTLLYLWKWLNGQESQVKEHRIKFFFGSAILGIILSVLFVGAVQRLKPNELKGNLEAGVLAALPLGPSLASTNITEVGTISGAGGMSTASTAGLNMLFIIRVVNAGSPTTAWNWKAFVVLPGGGQMEAQIPSISHIGNADPSSPLPPLPTAYGPYSLKMEDNLPTALSSSPLMFGAGKQGWVVVHVNDLTQPPAGAKFVITFEDVFGKQTKIEDVWRPGT